MADSIKHTAIHGTIWSFIERFSVQLVQFVITIIMARILTPTDYGLIGILTIFMSLSQVFIDGGFSNALIQKKDVSEIDYSTVFCINVGISIIIYLILYFMAPLISDYYGQSILSPILRVYSLNLIINAFAAVQKTILTIKVDFKTQSKISLSAAFISGLGGIYCAYREFGVWALVIQSLILAISNVLLTTVYFRWHLLLVFSKDSFKNLFGFGSKLLIASVISAVYDNLYNIVIGKKFSAGELGYYTRARQFPDLLSVNISGIISRVSYPILSKVQDEDERLKNIYKKYIQISSFVIFPLLMLLVGLAKPIIVVLLTDKWIAVVPLMQILCFGLLWSGVTTINLSLLKVKGRSDLVLKLEVIKKVIAISILFISLLFNSLTAICYGIALYSIIGVMINTYYTDKILNYGFFSQIKDFGIYLFLSIVIMLEGLVVVAQIPNFLLALIIGLTVCPVTYLLLCYLARTDSLHDTLTMLRQLRHSI